MTEIRRLVNIKANVSRNYGGETVDFQMSWDVEASNFMQLSLEYEKMMTMLHRQHQLYSGRALLDVPKPSSGKADRPEEWVACDKVVSEVKNGKVYYAIMGGKYSVHGVRIWDEVMKQFGIEYVPDGKGGMALYNKEMLVIEEDGKKKVTKVRDRQ